MIPMKAHVITPLSHIGSINSELEYLAAVVHMDNISQMFLFVKAVILMVHSVTHGKSEFPAFDLLKMKKH